MGGHGIPKLPDYKIYKVENCPELLETQNALAARGLKNPWLRNDVWRYDADSWGTKQYRSKIIFARGFRLGFGAFLVTAIGSAVYNQVFPDDHHHHH